MLAIAGNPVKIIGTVELMSAPAFPQCRILVVDDEPFVCDAVKMMLNFDGHVVETASNGKEALALFEKGKFDLVITDFAMPSMKGDELAAEIKARARILQAWSRKTSWPCATSTTIFLQPLKNNFREPGLIMIFELCWSKRTSMRWWSAPPITLPP